MIIEFCFIKLKLLLLVFEFGTSGANILKSIGMAAALLILPRIIGIQTLLEAASGSVP